MRPPRTRSRGCRRNSSRVATPKLPPPPRRPHSSSSSPSGPARTTSPRGVTTSAPSRLSEVRPCWAVRWPIPPPNASPATPVEPTTPPGVARPNACVAASKSSHVAPPPERAIRALGSTSTARIAVRSTTSPSSHTQCPAGLCPPPRTATSSSFAPANSSAVATSAAPRQRAITAGLRSTSALKQRRVASYPSSSGTRTSPDSDRRSSVSRPCTPVSFVLGPLEDQDWDALADRLRVREPHPLTVARLREKPPAGPEDHREHHQVDLVDHVVLDQVLHEPEAAGNLDDSVHFPPQLLHFREHVSLHHRRVVPLGVLERRGHHVLGHRVELVGERALALRPRVREALVRNAPDQQRIGLACLVELELVAILSAVEVEAPSRVLELLPPRRLHDAVQRDELGYDDPSHLDPPLSGYHFQPIS